MELTDYERKRNENIKNNEAMVQSLHLRKLVESLSKTTKRKSANKHTRCHKNMSKNVEDEGSDSEYDPCLEKCTQSDEDNPELEKDGIGQDALEEEICTSTRPHVKASLMAPGGKHHSKYHRITTNDVQSSTPMCTRSLLSGLNSPPVDGINMPISLNTSVGGQSQLGNNLNEDYSTFNTNNHTIDGDACEDQHAQVHSNSSLAVSIGGAPTPKRRDVRKRTMGHGLDKINERHGSRLAIFVPEGKIRPEHPVQAAKLASECGVALRDHLPIHPHWKNYKKTRLVVDVNHDGPSKKAYEQIQLRGPPPNVNAADWEKLLKKWNDPKHKETCDKKKENRGQVKLHQRTGSRSYIAHRFSLRSKFQNRDPDAIEFFGECMTSSKKGCTEFAKEVIDKMELERQREPDEGEEPKSPTQIAAETLGQVSSNTQLISKMGITLPSKKAKTVFSTSQIDKMMQAEREVAARVQGELLHRIASQEEALNSNKTELDSTKEELQSTKDEVRQMRLRQAETELILRRLLEERETQSNA
ncbi:uncharacterized protein LOC107304598 [Oryza brachyantha]|uniref:uncharacterized protein LOC107304598 n=1 Tax=Oryza brachyantha TaxID=4533 RepID=UPI001ADBAD50|nr:uncharacterized protein LOC107304598 [Oryza brachyantha]